MKTHSDVCDMAVRHTYSLLLRVKTFPPLIISPSLHTHLSPPQDVYDSSDQAAHYHAWVSQLVALHLWPGTWVVSEQRQFTFSHYTLIGRPTHSYFPCFPLPFFLTLFLCLLPPSFLSSLYFINVSCIYSSWRSLRIVYISTNYVWQVLTKPERQPTIWAVAFNNFRISDSNVTFQIYSRKSEFSA